MSMGTSQPITSFMTHGALHVTGTTLLDSHNQPMQLKGVSTHGIGVYPQYVNRKSLETLRSYGANVIRLAMYTEVENGYLTGGDQRAQEQLIDQAVSDATDLGLYVIIDWHILQDGNPMTHAKEAVSYWDQMSRRYAAHQNVLYEICNEPNGAGVTWPLVKEYADLIIPVIRANDPDAVIIVGTPTWSQDVDQVAGSPVAQGDNVMYTLHFYAATHKEELREKCVRAIAQGTPVFISEFSICDASGNGVLDYESAAKWKALIDQYHLSFVGWNLSNKAESSAIVKPDCQKLDGWTMEDLTDSGKWLITAINDGKL